MNTSDVLNKAADLLQVRGWHGGGAAGSTHNVWFPEAESTHPVCMEGAIRLVGTTQEYSLAKRALIDYLTAAMPDRILDELGYLPPWVWNDRYAQSVDEVIEALRAAAIIAAAQETDVRVVAPEAELTAVSLAEVAGAVTA